MENFEDRKEKCPKCGEETWTLVCTDFYNPQDGIKERVVECLNCGEKFIERWLYEGTYKYKYVVGERVIF